MGDKRTERLRESARHTDRQTDRSLECVCFFQSFPSPRLDWILPGRKVRHFDVEVVSVSINVESGQILKGEKLNLDDLTSHD